MPNPTSSERPYPQIVVAGAGVIGCFVGGMLVRGAHAVTFFLREKLYDELSRQGLTITDFHDLDEDLSPGSFGMSLTPDCLKHADIILVTVKASGTRTMAHLIAAHAPKDAIVISLQNGLTAVDILREELPDFDVRAGIVPFSVSYMGGGHFHRCSSGDILIEKGKDAMARHLSVLDLTFHERKEISALQWGKLLMNLNNALNALSNLPLREELSKLSWRKLLADQIAEALAVLKAHGITPRMPGSEWLPARFVPFILRLPTPIYSRIARAVLEIDPHARSSMWDDLELGRPTEIDELQGRIVAMGQERGVNTVLNARVAALIVRAGEAGVGSPGLSAKAIRRG
ncbi:2-dehydropantoate 2-reductase [Shimia biformata]|uniref:2-dehydropantoate 2-reductase n=1 Tax=Shimia biformata TaxID=1294299 RepID=UPI001EF27A27|nr:2-dehydropantoate 2-reductase [Shimia biformata]